MVLNPDRHYVARFVHVSTQGYKSYHARIIIAWADNGDALILPNPNDPTSPGLIRAASVAGYAGIDWDQSMSRLRQSQIHLTVRKPTQMSDATVAAAVADFLGVGDSQADSLSRPPIPWDDSDQLDTATLFPVE